MEMVFLVLGVLVIVLTAFWVLFPVLVWQQLKELNKIAAASNATLQQLNRTAELTLDVIAALTPPKPPVVQPLPEPVAPPNLSIKCEFCAVVIEYTPAQSGTAQPCPNCGNEINLP